MISDMSCWPVEGNISDLSKVDEKIETEQDRER